MSSSLLPYRAPRILLCVHQFFPTFGAGTEVLVLSTAKAMLSIGYDVRIVTGALREGQGYSSDTYEYQGLIVHRIWTPYRQGQFTTETVLEEYYNQSLVPEFEAILDSFVPDLVHFFHFKNLTLSCLKSCLQRKVPTVFTPTDYWLACRTCQLLKPWGSSECLGPGPRAENCLKHLLINTNKRFVVTLAKKTPSLLISLIFRLFSHLPITKLTRYRRVFIDLKNRNSAITSYLSKIDLILPPTQSLESLLLANNIPRAKIQALRYAIEAPVTTRDLIAREHFRSQDFTIGFIGTLVAHKGCHVLLDAIKAINNRNVVVRIYGNTEHYPDYVASLKALSAGDQRIQFAGTFAHDLIGDVMAELDTLVIPSIWRENAPLVLLNAVASGTPVIASDVTGITEYLSTEDNVELFPAGDSQALAHILESRINSITEINGSHRTPRIAGSPLKMYAKALDEAYIRLMKRPYEKKENV
ncbi:glycosyltransferase [Pseudomonas lactucae]|uniref:Glycosyltransferase n=1 Tax=Pseudomonas lactucae TaxID=2813360 RepID=A0A9X0Y7R4_9PSED|nr:glycosyltransferase [Pseudomonas lactucae]MBN2975178.1 glycosyltransferase [Pseudomonas lactucae]MBN2986716.1 glycosyltransferase [Pseudomonas lactucae]